jgi:hypothetical protein
MMIFLALIQKTGEQEIYAIPAYKECNRHRAPGKSLFKNICAFRGHDNAPSEYKFSRARFTLVLFYPDLKVSYNNLALTEPFFLKSDSPALAYVLVVKKLYC